MLDILLYLVLNLLLLLSLTCTDEVIDDAKIEDKDEKTDSDDILVHPRFRHDEICLVAEVFLDVMRRFTNLRNVLDTIRLANSPEYVLSLQLVIEY